MTSHSQDRGTALFRALRSIPAHAFRREEIRVLDLRDYEKEVQATALYEEIRTYTREQLAQRAGWDASRSMLIASIIQQEIYGEESHAQER